MEDMGVTPASAGSEPLTASEASAQLSSLISGKPEPVTPTSQKPDSEPKASQSEEPEAIEPETADEAPDAEDDQPAQAEAEVEKPQTIRLDDGSEVTLDEVKRWRDAKSNFEADYTKKTMRISEHQKALEAKASYVAQQEQLVTQALPLAMQMMQANIPPPPDPNLINYDVASYLQQEKAHQAAVAQVEQAQRTMQQMQQVQAQQAEHLRQQQLAESRRVLFEKMPELKDDRVRSQKLSELSEGLKRYGFEEKDLEGVFDARVIMVLNDAVQMHAQRAKAEAEKAKVAAKVQGATPVGQPGKRISTNEQRAAERKQVLERAKHSGKPSDAASALKRLIEGSR